VPRFVLGLLAAFARSPQCPDFGAFLDADGRRMAEDLLAEEREIAPFEVDEAPYHDWGAKEPFSLAGRGPGECSAGVFDLIEVDLASAEDALRAGRLFQAAVLASRALLITRGEEARDDAHALELFDRHFLAEGLVDPRLGAVVGQARHAAQRRDPGEAFEGAGPDVGGLIGAVRALYESMGNSLRSSRASIACSCSSTPGCCEPQADT
jgi:sulfite reductase (ferredoxin)